VNPYWSYLLTAVGVFGLWLAGRKDRRGWMVGIGAQVLWIAYATATHQWGFYVSALAYGFVYAKNAHAWKPVSRVSDPLGWDEAAQRVHDIEPMGGGQLLHHSTCWCRQQPPSGPVCRYCGADCSEGRSWDGGDLYACPPCAEKRAKSGRPPLERDDPASRSW
jgi:hypothetical protein